MPKSVTTTTKETKPDTEQTLTLEGWLIEQSTKDDVAGILVYRNQDGKWARVFDMRPPFEEDLDTIFRSRGDGDYNFRPYNSLKRFGTSRVESVSGYGESSSSATKRAHTSDDDEAFDSLITQMRQQLRMQQLRDMLDDARERRDRTPSSSNGLDMEKMLTLCASLAAAFKDTTLSTILPILINKALVPPDPTDKLLDSVQKVLQIRDSLGGSNDMDDVPGWLKGALIMSNTPVGQHLMSSFLGRRPATATVTPVPAPTPPAIPPPGAPMPPPPEPTHAERIAAEGAARTGLPPEPILNAYKLLQEKISPLLKAAARKQSKNYAAYAEIIDDHLPGFIDNWIAAPFAEAAQMLAQTDPEWTTDAVLTQWLSECHAALAEDAKREAEHPDDDNDE